VASAAALVSHNFNFNPTARSCSSSKLPSSFKRQKRHPRAKSGSLNLSAQTRPPKTALVAAFGEQTNGSMSHMGSPPVCLAPLNQEPAGRRGGGSGSGSGASRAPRREDEAGSCVAGRPLSLTWRDALPLLPPPPPPQPPQPLEQLKLDSPAETSRAEPSRAAWSRQPACPSTSSRINDTGRRRFRTGERW